MDELPSKMSYNIANAKLWKPFFTKSFLYPGLASVQENEPKYLPIDNQYAINLEDKYVTYSWLNNFCSLFIFTELDRRSSYDIYSLDSDSFDKVARDFIYNH